MKRESHLYMPPVTRTYLWRGRAFMAKSAVLPLLQMIGGGSKRGYVQPRPAPVLNPRGEGGAWGGQALRPEGGGALVDLSPESSQQVVGPLEVSVLFS